MNKIKNFQIKKIKEFKESNKSPYLTQYSTKIDILGSQVYDQLLEAANCLEK